MRGSPSRVMPAPLSAGCTVIVRNFNSWNSCPPRPALVCRKITGLPEATRTATATISKIGDSRSNIAVATEISISRLPGELHQREGVTGIGVAEALTESSPGSRCTCEHVSPVLLSDRHDTVYYLLNFSVGHIRKNRQRETAGVGVFCLRQVSRRVAIALPIERMKVQRNEMDAGADAHFLELFDKRIASDIQLVARQTENEQMPRVAGVIVGLWR